MKKKILTIQDISCVGQCSLTVAMPVISAMGIETCILPSAILSTHTGGFKGYTFRDLTEDIPSIAAHWKKEKIEFDGLYTGYIGSAKQVEYVKKILKDFKKPSTITVIDPVMADNGKLYPGFDKGFAKEMASLCAEADIIVPNLTEASFLLDVPYVGEGYSKEYIEDLLVKLTTTLHCKKAMLTGVSFEPTKLGVATYDPETEEFFYYFRDRIPYSFHGTGDVFASSFFGALVQGKSLEKASKIAVDFTIKAMEQTLPVREEHWYGVKFEEALPYLIEISK